MNPLTGALCTLLAATVVRADVAETEDWSRIYLGARPSLTADGGRFAFEWNDRLWIAATTGGVAQVVATDGAAHASWPALSPDGARLAFLSDRDGGVRPYVLDLASGALRLLSRHSEQTLPFAFAPDGAAVLATVVRDHAETRRARRIALLPADGSAPEEVLFDAQGTDPALSPDGSRILFVRNAGNDIYRKWRTPCPGCAGEIWLHDRAAGTFTCVVRKPTRSCSPVWTPDGQGFYYVSSDGGTANVRHRDLASGAERAVTAFTGDGVLQPALSADGRVMILRRGFDFWRLDPAADRPEPVRLHLRPGPGWTPPAATRRRYYTAARNPDGAEHVAFGGEEGDTMAFSAAGVLYVMDTRNREPVAVHDARGLALARCGAFSPDGSALYYLVDRGDAADVWVARRADPAKDWPLNVSFQKTRLTRDDDFRSALSLSPDGSRLAWLNGTRRLVFADTNAQHRVLGPDRPVESRIAWSPNGRWVAAGLSDNNRVQDIWLISTRRKHRPFNLSRHFQWDGEPAWSPDGKVLAWSGRRNESPDPELLYVFLDNEEGRGPGGGRIDFRGLSERVHHVRTRASRPFFNKDSRTIAFDDGVQTSRVKITGDLKPTRLTGTRGTAFRWGTKKDAGRLLWYTRDGLPAHFEKTFAVKVYPEIDLPDYHELMFRSAWRRIRDRFYDSTFHGADWPAMRDKYLPAFRHATSYTVLQRLTEQLLGELDSSHLGLFPSDVSTRLWRPVPAIEKWQPTVAHLGLRFDPAHQGPGWKVRDVLRDGPADLARRGIRAGDLVTEIDGRKTDGVRDPADLLLGPAGRRIVFTFGHPGEPATNVVRVTGITWKSARRLLEAEADRRTRLRVHSDSAGRIGYVKVPRMHLEEFRKFENEVFSEGYGRDALIIDVRGNTGGFTADRMLDILCARDHSYEVPRNGRRGYLLSYTVHPVWTKPIAVLCDGASVSNAEIFTHAVKTLRRGAVVGSTTSGGVIARNESPLLDFGTFLDAEYGWYLPDGTDMEGHGAEPDIPVPLTPADEVRGADPQVDAAVRHLMQQL